MPNETGVSFYWTLFKHHCVQFLLLHRQHSFDLKSCDKTCRCNGWYISLSKENRRILAAADIAAVIIVPRLFLDPMLLIWYRALYPPTFLQIFKLYTGMYIAAQSNISSEYLDLRCLGVWQTCSDEQSRVTDVPQYIVNMQCLTFCSFVFFVCFLVSHSYSFCRYFFLFRDILHPPVSLRSRNSTESIALKYAKICERNIATSRMGCDGVTCTHVLWGTGSWQIRNYCVCLLMSPCTYM